MPTNKVTAARPTYAEMCAIAAGRAVGQARLSARAGLCQSLRLYYAPCTATRDGRLDLVPEGNTPPAGFVPAPDVPPLTPDLPYAEYGRWVRERARHLALFAPQA